MRILVVGPWKKEEALDHKNEADELGRILAERGHIIISGGGTGVSELVVNSYKLNKGRKYVAYIPSKKEMEKVGEKLGPNPDELIETNLDYPERNIVMVKNCDGLIALHGGLGTLTEIIYAVNDYNKKVSIIDKGKLADWAKRIYKIKEKSFITADIKKAVEHIEKNEKFKKL